MLHEQRERRGFGRLRKLPSKRWQAAYTGPDLVLHRPPSTFMTKDDAVAWLAAFGALALQRSPDWAARIAVEPDGFPAGPVARACAHETRRWAPFVPVLAAKADRDLDLPQGRLRRGERIVLNVHGTDHDPMTWPDPGTFAPGRFLPNDSPSRSDGFVPQGGGDVATGHRCPGESVAVELLAMTLRRLSRLGATLPPQDLTVDRRRMPTRPASGVRLALPTG